MKMQGENIIRLIHVFVEHLD